MSIQNTSCDGYDSDLDSGNGSDYVPSPCPSNISDVVHSPCPSYISDHDVVHSPCPSYISDHDVVHSPCPSYISDAVNSPADSTVSSVSDVDSAFDELATVIPLAHLHYDQEMKDAYMDVTFSEDDATVPSPEAANLCSLASESEKHLFQGDDILKYFPEDYWTTSPGVTFEIPSASTFTQRPVTPPACGNVHQLQHMPDLNNWEEQLTNTQHQLQFFSAMFPMNGTQSYVDFLHDQSDIVPTDIVPSDDMLMKNCSTLAQYINSPTNVASGNTNTDYTNYYDPEGRTSLVSPSVVPTNMQPAPLTSSPPTTLPPTKRPNQQIRWKPATRAPVANPIFPRPSNKPRLYNFLIELLSDTDQYTCIEWMDKSNGIFKFVQSAEVARLWGERKNKPNMKYENFARSLRTYISKGILTKPRNKLVYKFTTKISGLNM